MLRYLQWAVRRRRTRVGDSEQELPRVGDSEQQTPHIAEKDDATKDRRPFFFFSRLSAVFGPKFVLAVCAARLHVSV